MIAVASARPARSKAAFEANERTPGDKELGVTRPATPGIKEPAYACRRPFPLHQREQQDRGVAIGNVTANSVPSVLTSFTIANWLAHIGLQANSSDQSWAGRGIAQPFDESVPNPPSRPPPNRS
jgi:hypothetical protein